jgi:hypothetical protein
LGCDDDEGEGEGDGDGRVAGWQGVDDAGGHAEAGPGEDVVLENLGGDVGSDNRAEGPPGQCGSTPGGRDDGDEDTDADQDRHGHKASDEGGESRILSG